MADGAAAPEHAAPAALLAELEQAHATAREQLALLRSSLATVAGFLDRETG